MTVLAERVPVINKDAAFEHLHHRDDEGQFSAMGHVARMLRSLSAVGAGGAISPHDEPDHGMDFSTVHPDGRVSYDVTGDEDNIQFDLPPGDLARLHKVLTDSLEADDDDGSFQVDENTENPNPDVTIAWEKTRKFSGVQQYKVTVIKRTEEEEGVNEEGEEDQEFDVEEEYLETAIDMSERDMRDWQVALTISLLSEPALAGSAGDVAKALIATLTKDYDPDQLRDDHGRWSKIGAALHAIGEAMGTAVRAHATFGGPEGSSDSHGLVTLHDRDAHGRLFAVNLHDKDVGTQWAATLGSEDAEELVEGLYAAVEKGRAGQSGSIGNYVDETDAADTEWWRLDYAPEGSTLHFNLGEEDVEQEILLSHDDADSLREALDDMRSTDPDNPLQTRPLPEGHNLESRKAIDGDDRDLMFGVVSTPAGIRVRLGLAGTEEAPIKRWTGGSGEMVADLGPDEAAQLGADLSSITEQMKAYEHNLALGDQAIEDWYETEHGLNYSQMMDEGWSLVSRGDGTGHGSERVVLRRKADKSGYEDVSQTPPEIDAEFRALHAEQEQIWSDLGLVDEGDTIGEHEIATPWGTVTLEVRGQLLDYDRPTDLKISVRPRGESAEDWDPGEDRAILGLAGVKKLQRMLRDAFATDVVKGAKGDGKPGGGGANLEHYWKHGEGAAKWIGHPHPWTALYHHLRKHMVDEMAKRTASQWFKDVTGMWPGERKGKNPVGRG